MGFNVCLIHLNDMTVCWGVDEMDELIYGVEI